MKKTLLYLILFAFLCACSSYGIDYLVYKKIDNQSPYYLSFASIGAISLESQIDCWAKINMKLSQDELIKEMEELIGLLGFSMIKNNLVSINENDEVLVKYVCRSNDFTYTFTAQTDSNLDESYFLINVIGAEENNELLKIEDKLRKDNLQWHFYYLYTGKLDHYSNQESRKQLIDVILENLDADSSEIYEDKYLTSSTAYTPVFTNSITVQDKKYNVQIAVKSISQRQETMIHIGQPLILGDY